MNVDGRGAVVTGAGRGIGRAVAQRLAEAGARVLALDVDPGLVDELQEALGPEHLARACDVSDEAAVAEALAEGSRRLGPIALCVANAGVATGGDLLSASAADWDRAFAVNVRAHVAAARWLLPGWLRSGEGYFVSVASAAGLLTQIGSAPYATSKHAAVAFAEWLSITYGDRGVRVTCVCPMGVQTAMLEPGMDGALDAVGASVVRGAGAVVAPEAVAAQILDTVTGTEEFLLLPHPEVLTYFQRKAGDYERWLAGMRRLQADASGPNGRVDTVASQRHSDPTD